MASKVLIVEIGDCFIKAGVVSKSKNSSKLLKAFYFPTPEGAVQDGQIIEPKVVATLINEQLMQRTIKNVKHVSFILTSSKIISREITLPPVKEKRLEALVVAGAPDYFPVDVSAYKISYSVLEKTEGDNVGYRVLVTLAPTSLLSGYSSIATYAKLKLKTIDHISNSQYQLFKRLPSEGTTMFVAIAARQTITTFMQSDNLLMQRTFPFGGEDIMQKAEQVGGLGDNDNVRALELVSDKGWVDQNLSEEQYNDAIFRIINGIMRSADFFKSAHKGARVDKIVLLDTCSEIANLKQSVADTMEIETVALSELPHPDITVLENNFTMYASFLGSLYAPLDLLPELGRDRKRKRYSRSPDSLVAPILTMILCIVSGVSISAVSILDYWDAQDELARVQKDVEELRYVEQTFTQYVNYGTMMENIMLLEAVSTNNNEGLRAFIEELEVKMPSNLILLSAECDTMGVTMDLTVESMEEAAVTLAQLRTFESIKHLEVSDIAEEEEAEEMDIGLVSFSVSCSYNVPESEIPDEYIEEAPMDTDDIIAEVEDMGV